MPYDIPQPMPYMPQAQPMPYAQQAQPMPYAPQAQPMPFVPQAQPMPYVPEAQPTPYVPQEQTQHVEKSSSEDSQVSRCEPLLTLAIRGQNQVRLNDNL